MTCQSTTTRTTQIVNAESDSAGDVRPGWRSCRLDDGDAAQFLKLGQVGKRP